ncbi:hypothetical protein KDA14_04275 [Candidatus Saccharibacteria bacterium]|nr:hypothetical protein [Candidatus Saccharibacteria bacterium]
MESGVFAVILLFSWFCVSVCDATGNEWYVTHTERSQRQPHRHPRDDSWTTDTDTTTTNTTTTTTTTSDDIKSYTIQTAMFPSSEDSRSSSHSTYESAGFWVGISLLAMVMFALAIFFVSIFIQCVKENVARDIPYHNV